MNKAQVTTSGQWNHYSCSTGYATALSQRKQVMAL